MKVLNVRNVHQALPRALDLIEQNGVLRESRNGPVLVAPWPVTTVYECPRERVVFWDARDFNIAFCIYEALWMLVGRRDVLPLTRYVKDFGQFSDDGETLNGAYGYRWKRHFIHDQLDIIASRLVGDHSDRRSVLQMWDCNYDLGSTSKDVPCNTMATFQVNDFGSLDLTVFCRSNDIYWGAYFANAFHFGVLLEYMASRIMVPVGVYRQISVNWHLYVKRKTEVEALPRSSNWDPYGDMSVRPPHFGNLSDIRFYSHMEEILAEADSGFHRTFTTTGSEFLDAAYYILKAHHVYQNTAKPEAFQKASHVMDSLDPQVDWVSAMNCWLANREERWVAKQERKNEAEA